MFVKLVSYKGGNREELVLPCDHTIARTSSEDKIEIELCYRPQRREKHIVTIPDDAEVVYLLNDRGDILEAKRLNGRQFKPDRPAQFRTG